jgi:DNA-binding FadR family transcriptional regulator
MRTTIKDVLGTALDMLGENIVAGHYPAGSSIPPEPLLGEEPGVSRTLVREAIKSLVAKGIVSTGPKVGTRVLSAERRNWFDPDVVARQSKIGLTRELLRELQELRHVVAPAAVRLAAQRATPADIAAVETAFAGMKAGIELGGDDMARDLRFHQGPLKACHNRMRVQMGKAIGALLRSSFESSTSKPDGPRESLPLHRAVLDAVIARSPARAEPAILMLIDGAKEGIELVLASRRKLPSLVVPAPQIKTPSRSRMVQP